MRRLRQLGLVLIVLVAALQGLPYTMSYGQTSNGGYDIDWSSVDDGGMVGTANGYELTSIVGQPDIAQRSEGDYQLNGGFWSVAPQANLVHLPLVVK